MKNRKGLLFTSGFLFFMGVVLIMGQGVLFASETCQIIRIEKASPSAGRQIEIFPNKATVPVGSCTVWMNWVVKGEVQVSFRENAQACISSTKSSSGFSKGKSNSGESCYMTEKLARGKTASLYWDKPGVYKYTIELTGVTSDKPNSLMATGIIEVK
ncbi:MAG: hypothetical protein HKP58_00425 [Desulfatitalea sp.]|nr:hypothetical protein [Desulfatitalea sp.]NNJ98855.1 hypothetical protein [Desulfatitalea sp.]